MKIRSSRTKVLTRRWNSRKTSAGKNASRSLAASRAGAAGTGELEGQISVGLQQVVERAVPLDPGLLVESLVDLAADARIDQLLEVLVLDGSALSLEHEPVLQGGQLPLLGHL